MTVPAARAVKYDAAANALTAGLVQVTMHFHAADCDPATVPDEARSYLQDKHQMSVSVGLAQTSTGCWQITVGK